MPTEGRSAAPVDDRLSGLAVTPAAIRSAAAILAGRVHRTPLLSSRTLDAATGGRVFSKAENLQRSGSFKIRGALNRLSRLAPEERTGGAVAYSSGNHAQGVALAAQLLGMRAVIVMPSDAPRVKRDATAAYGAEIVEYDRYADDREVIAARIASDRGAVIVPPFNDLDVIAGQGTVGLEIAQQLRARGITPNVAVVPVGGGGLASGTAIALIDAFPSIRIIGVEPETADDARQSLLAGTIVRIKQPTTIADGVATQSIGTHTFPLLRSLLDEIVTVSEGAIASALSFVLERMKQVVEPTGALTTAALLEGAVATEGRVVVSIFCGGNLDFGVLGQAEHA
jgi:threo-3-hydroxy-L-aspartate ammonia-lyase